MLLPAPPPYNPTGSSLVELDCVTAGFVSGSGTPPLFVATLFEAEGEESRAGVVESRAAGKGQFDERKAEEEGGRNNLPVLKV